MSKILVTGANGLLGSTIVKQLLENGAFEITALVRFGSDLSLLENSIQKIQIDNTSLFDIKGLESLLTDIDFIIHCAALVNFNAGKFSELKKINVGGTSNLINVALESGVKKFVHISSVATLSKSKDDSLYNEKSKWIHSTFNSDYAVSKYLSEQEVWRGIHEGLPATILNPSLILGPGNFEKTSLQIVEKVFQSKGYHPPGGNAFVDVDDVATISIKSLSSDYNGKRYIVSAANLTYQDLFTKILSHPQSGFKGKIKPMPKFLLILLTNFTKLFEKLFKISVIVSYQAVKNMGAFPRYDNSLSIQDYNYTYKNIDTTIDEMVTAYFNKKAQTFS